MAPRRMFAVGCGMERERQQCAEPGFTKDWPEDAAANDLKLRKSVINQENLHQQRRSTEEGDVAHHREPDDRAAIGCDDAKRQGEQGSANKGHKEQLHRGQRTVEQRRNALQHQGPVHTGDLLSPRINRPSNQAMRRVFANVRVR